MNPEVRSNYVVATLAKAGTALGATGEVMSVLAKSDKLAVAAGVVFLTSVATLGGLVVSGVRRERTNRRNVKS